MSFYIIAGLVVVAMGFWVYKLYQDKKESDREVTALEKEKNEYAELGQELTEYNQKLQEKKEQAKAKILEMFATQQDQDKQARISNSDVAKKLDISRASAFRYLDELEKQGNLKQISKTGRGVYYKRI